MRFGFGSRPIFRAGKIPKIAFLGLSLLPNPTETLAPAGYGYFSREIICSEKWKVFWERTNYHYIIKETLFSQELEPCSFQCQRRKWKADALLISSYSSSSSSTGTSITVASRQARSTRNWGCSFPLPFLPCAPTTFAARERETSGYEADSSSFYGLLLSSRPITIVIYNYYTSDSLWKTWLVESIQPIHNSLWTWHDKCNICCRYCSSTSAWLLSPLESSPEKQNGWTLRFCFWGWILWKMYNKTII